MAGPADRSTECDREACLILSIHVPEDETCLYLFEGASSDAVEQMASSAGLSFERVTPVIAAWTDPPRTDPPGSDPPTTRSIP
jgi:hypothetical protein